MNEETMIAIPVDFDVSVAGLEYGLLRDLRLIWVQQALTTEAFVARYSIPTDDYTAYEWGYVRSLDVICNITDS